MTTDTILKPALRLAAVDLGRAFRGRRGIPLILMATLAPLLTLVVGYYQGRRLNLSTEYANLFTFFILSGTLFFGTGWCFSSLFRGEVLERSLHYFFLTPVRREAITLGKYFTGVAATWLVFVPGTVLSYLFLFGQGGPSGTAHLTSARGVGVLLAYTGITFLACAAYGAVFLALGLVAKSPFVPIAGVWLFERISTFLPVMLKRLTVGHYLNSLAPVPSTLGVFSLLAEPEPLAVALLLPVALAAAILYSATRRVRSMEISYGVD